MIRLLTGKERAALFIVSSLAMLPCVRIVQARTGITGLTDSTGLTGLTPLYTAVAKIFPSHRLPQQPGPGKLPLRTAGAVRNRHFSFVFSPH